MHALHLPGVPAGQIPPFRFPDKPGSPASLQYSTNYPRPKEQSPPSSPTYLLRVLLTALTRGELSWSEVLDPARFHPHGGAIPGHDVIGDKVWALLDFDRDGAAAEYTIANEAELSLAPKNPIPQELSDEEWDERLATLPLSGLTAYQALFTHGRLPLPTSPIPGPTKRVLILGAAGSVGLPTTQLAKAANFTVIATASAASASVLAQILDPHTDKLIDYTSPTYTSIADVFVSENISPVDLLVDCIGGETLTSLLSSTDPPLSSILAPNSRVVTIAAPLKAYGESILSAIQANCAKAGVSGDVEFFIVKPNGQELDTLRDLVTKGTLKGHVLGDKVFTLEHGAQAMEAAEARGRKGAGKVVIRVARE